ncbi:MAG: hypothetical protein ACRDGS_04975, partial [Chloroflexota bacterium]
TDLTRMRHGRVCIAGYDAAFQCVRPVLPPPGIPETALLLGRLAIVYPAAEVEFDFGHAQSEPPHTEDIYYTSRSVRLIGRVSEARWRDLLTSTLSLSVEALFDRPIMADHGWYVWQGGGKHSLGTVAPSRIREVVHEQKADGTWGYRLGFDDRKGAYYKLSVTDLAWRYVCDRLRSKGRTPRDIEDSGAQLLRNRAVFLRIGLARPSLDTLPDRCFLQITGIHTFPDYLKGRTFADFAP